MTKKNIRVQDYNDISGHFFYFLAYGRLCYHSLYNTKLHVFLTIKGMKRQAQILYTQYHTSPSVVTNKIHMPT